MKLLDLLASRRSLAKASYIPADRDKVVGALKYEEQIANAIGGKTTGYLDSFDIIKGNVAIEVKVIVKGANDKVTMHPSSKDRKEKEKYKTFTVAVDARGATPVFYYKEGLGSFRLGGMTKVDSISDLKGVLK